MKIKIKTYNGDLPSYLTLGMVYRVSGRTGEALIIYCNDNQRIFISVDNCQHLNGGSWEIINE